MQTKDLEPGSCEDLPQTTKCISLHAHSEYKPATELNILSIESYRDVITREQEFLSQGVLTSCQFGSKASCRKGISLNRFPVIPFTHNFEVILGNLTLFLFRFLLSLAYFHMKIRHEKWPTLEGSRYYIGLPYCNLS